ncbi:hypothetical protein BDD43_0315 [Mucilaginibacter gracilis]|uniref:Uncharacterized protein n=1 Tax=Mucilaginibacter gracilis TaxID=423350 RepID=A0A495IWH4_9SPHI|nr:hypothetical protein [Mucilaginibacter gracilis]RKR80219.1 hypothetical protein BDD43_0315 [Mucilaginibacter gracilis]
MTEIFTTTINSTPNSLKMNEQDTIENIGVDETTFYHSICADLDLMVTNPRFDTVQSILNHSQNLR